MRRRRDPERRRPDEEQPPPGPEARLLGMKRSPADLTGDDGFPSQQDSVAQSDPDGESAVPTARVGLSV